MVDKCGVKRIFQSCYKILFVLCLFYGSVQFVISAHAQNFNDYREPIKTLIVKIRSGNSFGTGIVVSVQGDYLYIITAHHVVADENIKIEFDFLRGTYIEGEHWNTDTTLDLELLRVPLDSLKSLLFNELTLPFHHLQEEIAELNRGDTVYPAGHPMSEIQVYIPEDPPLIRRVDLLEIDFEFNCQNGYSGGGLFDNSGNLVGMILRNHQDLYCEAIPFQLICQRLEQRLEIDVSQQPFIISPLNPVDIEVNPSIYKEILIEAGTDSITFAVSENLLNNEPPFSFEWELIGCGELLGDVTRPVIHYRPPDEITNTCEKAKLTVYAKRNDKYALYRGYDLKIVPAGTLTASLPSSQVIVSFQDERSQRLITQATQPILEPDSEPDDAGGISSGTVVVALGAAAAATLGVIAVLPDDKVDDTSGGCSGITVNNFCWYRGDPGQSCDVVCGSHGGYHEATRTYAGSDGSDGNCYTVLSALGAPVNYEDQVISQPMWASLGCCYWFYENRARWTRDPLPTTSNASYSTIYRVCACKE